jgi:hypothetical protein
MARPKGKTPPRKIVPVRLNQEERMMCQHIANEFNVVGASAAIRAALRDTVARRKLPRPIIPPRPRKSVKITPKMKEIPNESA